ncbi:hypothetical protein GN956_G684 [Arapaima gigas]
MFCCEDFPVLSSLPQYQVSAPTQELPLTGRPSFAQSPEKALDPCMYALHVPQVCFGLAEQMQFCDWTEKRKAKGGLFQCYFPQFQLVTSFYTQRSRMKFCREFYC